MAMQLYPQSSHNAFHGVGIVYPPHVDQAVQQIYGACKGFGTDEQTLITVLGSKSPETRTLIALRYEELYKKPLRDLIKSETSGDFGRLLRMISTPLHETEAQILRDATKGVGTTESLIVQILSGRTNVEMNILKKTFFKMFNKDLAVTMSSELSGDLKKIMMAVLQSQQLEFNPVYHTAAKAEEEATKLYKAGQGRLGTNEEVFIATLVACPPEFLQMVDAAYVRKHNNNIAKAIDKEFSGDAKKSLTYLVKSVMDPYPTIAEVIEKTMKGFGTNETGLSTALVRYHGVLPQVKVAYKKLYGKELRDRINGETSGDYRKLLLEIYDAPQDPPLTTVKPGTPGAPAQVGATTAPGGYPSAAPVGYPAPQGYPPATAPAAGYPGATAPGYPPQGYPPHGQPGYPPQGQQPGHPPQGAPGYPPQGAPGYPPPGGAPGYPLAPGYPQQVPGYPTPTYPPQQYQAAPGYPPQGQYPPPGQYPSQAQYPGYPQGGTPPQQGYPPQGAPGYPPQQGYPPQGAPGYPPQQGYPPQGAPGYPPQQGYPPQGQYPPPGQYPPRGY